VRNAPADMGVVRRDCTACTQQIFGPKLLARKAGERLFDR
jgi:hypothetical protein